MSASTTAEDNDAYGTKIPKLYALLERILMKSKKGMYLAKESEHTNKKLPCKSTLVVKIQPLENWKVWTVYVLAPKSFDYTNQIKLFVF